MSISLTGVGGLSRKLSAILMVAGMLLSGISQAVDNSIFIDQAGDSNNVTIQQNGGGNLIGGTGTGAPSDTNRARINGDNNVINIEQTTIAAGNKLKLDFNNDNNLTTGGGTRASSLNYQVTGANNLGVISVGGSSGGKASNTQIDIQQTGDNNVTGVAISGNSNSVLVNTEGGNNTISSTITGNSNSQNITFSGATTDSNSVTATQTGNGQLLAISTVGGGVSNTFNVTQTDGGHSATLAVTNGGSSNTFNVYQQGSAAVNILDAKTSGNSNTFNINQNKP
jgi:hypothetical protein